MSKKKDRKKKLNQYKEPSLIDKSNKKILHDKGSKNYNRLYTIFYKYSGLWMVLLVITLIIFIGLFGFKDYLSLKLSYFFKDIGSDTLNTRFPNINYNPETADNRGYSAWSFYIGMGYNVFGGILVNPVDYFFGHITNWVWRFYGGDYGVSGGFPHSFYTHILFAGICFYFYLRTMSVSPYVSLIGALLFSFTGYATLGGTWGHTQYIFKGAFLLFSFEQLFTKNRWIFFPIAILTLSNEGFTLYMFAGVFLGVYFLFRYFDSEEFNLKNFFGHIAKMAGLGLVGLAMNCINLVSIYMKQLMSPRVLGNASYAANPGKASIFQIDNFPEHLTLLYRTFSNDLLGNGSYFKGWYNYLEAPAFYCGLITLLLIPQIFIFLKKRNIITHSLFFSFWALVALFPLFRHAVQGFIGNYYKAAIDVIIPSVMLFAALVALDKIIKENKINRIVLACTFIFLMFLLYFPFLPAERTPIDKPLREVITVFIILHAILLFLLSFEKVKIPVQIAILITVTIELAYLTNISMERRFAYSMREIKSNSGGYQDNTIEAVNLLRKIDKSFYRLEKDYRSGTSQHSSVNDAQIQGYYGTPVYSSLNQYYYIRFLEETEIIQKGNETQTRWAPGLTSRPLLQTIGNVKYYLTKDNNSLYLQRGFAQKIAQTGGIQILKNNYYLPLGFSYDKFIRMSTYKKFNVLQKDVMLFKGFVVDDDNKNFAEITKGYEELGLKDTIALFNFPKYFELTEELKKDTLALTEHRQSVIKGTSNLSKRKMMFFSIPYDMGWSAKIDGKDAPLFISNIGFIGINVDPGPHEIVLEYWPPFFKLSQFITRAAYIILILILIIKNLNNIKILPGKIKLIIEKYKLKKIQITPTS